MNNPVVSLAIAGNNDVYAGGYFSTTDGKTTRNVAHWNGSTWEPLGNGTNSDVDAMAVAPNGDLLVGGRFTIAGVVAANRVARWNGTTWSSLGTGLANGVSNFVYALTVGQNGHVYVGGLFLQAGGLPAKRLARWDGTTWSSMGAGTGDGADDVVMALRASSDGSVYAVGNFTQAGRVVALKVARWTGNSWQALRTGVANGIKGSLNVLAVAPNGDVYVGGQFTQAGGVVARNIARWDGTNWSALRAEEYDGVNSVVYALAVAANGDVYVGGGFTQAGRVTANGVAHWNGRAWNSLGTGAANGAESGDVTALAMARNGDVYMGGRFTRVGGLLVNHIARWDGTTWHTLGTGNDAGIRGSVLALAVAPNGDVIAGGEFLRAGAGTANRVARWNGTTWSSLGTGLANGVNNTVYALAVAKNGDVYVGGEFREAGGAEATYLARWNGVAWAALGAGVNGAVLSIALAEDGAVYAGGFFRQASGIDALKVARWNTTSWEVLGSGLNGGVWSIALGLSGQLYVGGNFSALGDGSKVSRSFGFYTSAAVVTSAAPARVRSFTLYPNPTKTSATIVLPAASYPRFLLLFDAAGREVRRQPVPAHTTIALLHTNTLPPGLYTVRIGNTFHRLLVE
ncbi:T9SS type A sorting domain-containing protein [Hymenobacter lapidiphilus]|uniref:T9SS type A sorting domain-containing protein n=1 Tax=Hymenobacter lapidiphilus TaxID=2608003 RepID=A0A7Y7PS98_9BACT|nr:T9SS type A sorting domain-containing protein [Hymenobacter lapidiphilus]NVO33115.1 T9SS type A sorting domain-containing protein [Hymenobacter lapidiphilus]